MTKRRRRRHHLVTPLVSIAALAGLALLVWWLLQGRPLAERTEPQHVEQPRAKPDPALGGEDLTAAERQSLQEILKRHGAVEGK
jgi:hypothetical protein